MTSLPVFGHLKKDRRIRIEEPIERATFIERGRHLILGQRKNRGLLDSLIFLGKCIEHTKIQDKYDANIWLDVSFPHAIFLSGTRGSGKSFDIGVIIEGLVLPPNTKVCTNHKPVSMVVFDLQNQFWTLSLKPDRELSEDKEHINLLKEWELEPTSVHNVKLFAPSGSLKLIGEEQELVLSTSDLTANDLCSFWKTDIYSPQGHLILTIIEKVSKSGYGAVKKKQSGERVKEHIPAKSNYEIDNLIRCLQTDEDINNTINSQVIDAVLWRLQSLNRSGLFKTNGIPIHDLLCPNQTSVLLLRSLDDATKALVTGVIMRKVYALMGEYHTKRKVGRRLKKHPIEEETRTESVWCVIDEAHVVCPAEHETSATRALIEYVKRGRDAGLSLLLATQQPSAIDTRVISQVDLTLVHRLTLDGDISAALARIPAHLPEKILVGTAKREPRIMVRLLDSGEAIFGDSQTDRAFLGVVRPRLTAHGGSEPK